MGINNGNVYKNLGMFPLDKTAYLGASKSKDTCLTNYVITSEVPQPMTRIHK